MFVNTQTPPGSFRGPRTATMLTFTAASQSGDHHSQRRQLGNRRIPARRPDRRLGHAERAQRQASTWSHPSVANVLTLAAGSIVVTQKNVGERLGRRRGAPRADRTADQPQRHERPALDLVGRPRRERQHHHRPGAGVGLAGVRHPADGRKRQPPLLRLRGATRRPIRRPAYPSSIRLRPGRPAPGRSYFNSAQSGGLHRTARRSTWLISRTVFHSISTPWATSPRPSPASRS